MEKSGFLKLNLLDFFKGLIMAVLASVIGVIQSSLDAGVLTFDWQHIGKLAIAGGFAYIVKNLFEGEKVNE